MALKKNEGTILLFWVCPSTGSGKGDETRIYPKDLLLHFCLIPPKGLLFLLDIKIFTSFFFF